jgi:O-antigen/teichoic acid export membrane protein
MSSEANFGARVRIGAIWAYGAQVFVTVLTFIVGVIMARVLGPADFGVFIAVTAFTSIALVVVQFGMPPALIQAPTLYEEEKNAAFWLVLLMGIAFVAIALLVAVPLGQAYQSMQFAPVMWAMSAVFVLTAPSCVGLALLRRDMAFDKVARINAVAHVTAAVLSVVAALLGLGVYSLALGALVAMTVTSIGVVRFGSWRPSWPSLRPVLSLLRYAWFSLINNGQDMAINRADNIIVGVLLGTLSLGLYNRAFSLARLPSEQFADSLGPVLLGALSRIQNDLDWSLKMFFKAVSAIATLTLPFLALLFVGGPTFVLLIYGEAWAGAGPPLQVMVFGGFFMLLTSLQMRLAFAQGLVRESAWVHLGVLLATLVLTLAAAPFGLIAIAAAMVMRDVLWSSLLAKLLARSALGVRYADTLHAGMPPLLAAGGATLVTWLVVDIPADDTASRFLGLAEMGLVLFAVYGLLLGVMAIVWQTHGPLQSTKELVWDSLAGRIGGRRRRVPASR